MVKSILFLICSILLSMNSLGAQMETAASATNEFGLDLYHQLATGDDNLCLSPYSIESAFAMTFAGADGKTRTEMMRTLHLPENSDAIPASFAALQKSLEAMTENTKAIVAQTKSTGRVSDPITLNIANRLFAEKGYDFRESFLALVKTNYNAPLEPLDFSHNPEAARTHINDWVAEQTRKRIRDLIPVGAIDATTRMVLTNALYLKAPWAHPFEKEATKPAPFHVKGGAPVDVPMMHERLDHVGYAKQSGFTAFCIPYAGDELNFVVLLPDDVKGLATLEKKLTPALLTECAKLPTADINLSFPKFKFEPPTIPLKQQLEALGMKSAFDAPPGSANFDKLAPRRPNEYLYLSSVFHKTFIAVDEKGTEAAAATAAVVMLATSAMRPSGPVEINVDRPFLYAIQHAPSSVCLFLGRVNDPR